jgi:hypothetical protein
VNTGQCPNTTSFVLTPAQMQCQPPDAVQGMLLMGSTECRNCLLVSGAQYCRLVVVGTPGYAQVFAELLTPSRVDLVQDG